MPSPKCPRGRGPMFTRCPGPGRITTGAGTAPARGYGLRATFSTAPQCRRSRPSGRSARRDRTSRYSRPRCQGAIDRLLENVSSSRMYSSAVYLISQSNRRRVTSANSPLASISARPSRSVSVVGETQPDGIPEPISSYTSWICAKNGSPPDSGTTWDASQNARYPPGRSSDHALRYFTAGSIQCHAVAANSKPNPPAPSSRTVPGDCPGVHDSKSACSTRTRPNPARFRLASAASAPPSSTQLIANPRRASGSVALPEAHPTSHSSSTPGVTPVSEMSASYSASGYSGRASWYSPATASNVRRSRSRSEISSTPSNPKPPRPPAPAANATDRPGGGSL